MMAASAGRVAGAGAGAPAPAPAPTFIKAIEYWVPNADRSVLEFGGGLYGPASRMARISKEMCFGRGEGLPGRAWDLGEPVVLHSFDGSYFKRTAAAQADGLTCGIALPIFTGDYLGSVVVFFCGDGDNHAEAVEVWKNDPTESKDLKLADGHYGLTGDTFEFISQRTSFRPGTGLPGLAWLQNAPVFLPDLGKGSGFLRGDSAVKVGINRGLALLPALDTPIARRLEIWRPDLDHAALILSGGFCVSQGLPGRRGHTGGHRSRQCRPLLVDRSARHQEPPGQRAWRRRHPAPHSGVCLPPQQGVALRNLPASRWGGLFFWCRSCAETGHGFDYHHQR